MWRGHGFWAAWCRPVGSQANSWTVLLGQQVSSKGIKMGIIGSILKNPEDLTHLLKLKWASVAANRAIPSDPNLAFCYQMLGRVGQSFSVVILALELNLRNAVSTCIHLSSFRGRNTSLKANGFSTTSYRVFRDLNLRERYACFQHKKWKVSRVSSFIIRQAISGLVAPLKMIPLCRFACFIWSCEVSKLLVSFLFVYRMQSFRFRKSIELNYVRHLNQSPGLNLNRPSILQSFFCLHL